MTWDVRSGVAGRVVVVTGAGGAIGGAVAAAVAEAGGTVLGIDLDRSEVANVVATLPGGNHQYLHADITDLASHQEIFTMARDMGPLRGLAHVAAVLLRQEDIDDVTEAEWDLQHDVNLKATFFLNRAARNALRTVGDGGSIVNFTSQGWWTGGVGSSIVYASTKGGVVSLTRGLARTFATDSIRVNAVSPGGVDTAMMRGGLSDAALERFLDAVPLGRLAQPDEIAGAVIYLLSDASSYVTGAVLNISGGQLMY